MLKKCLIAGSFIILSFLCGCNGSSELENRDFVLAAGLVGVPNGYKACVGIAVLSPESSEIGSELNIKTAEGKSAVEAFENLDDVTSGKLFFGHTLVMMTDDTSKNELISFCKNNKELSRSIILLNCNDIENVLAEKYGKSTSSAFIEKYYDTNKKAKKITLSDVLINESKGVNVELPVIELKDKELCIF